MSVEKKVGKGALKDYEMLGHLGAWMYFVKEGGTGAGWSSGPGAVAGAGGGRELRVESCRAR